MSRLVSNLWYLQTTLTTRVSQINTHLFTANTIIVHGLCFRTCSPQHLTMDLRGLITTSYDCCADTICLRSTYIRSSLYIQRTVEILVKKNTRASSVWRAEVTFSVLRWSCYGVVHILCIAAINIAGLSNRSIVLRCVEFKYASMFIAFPFLFMPFVLLSCFLHDKYSCRLTN